MNTIYRPMPLDYTLKALELIADQKGLQLEDVDGYVSLCKFLTDLESKEASNQPIEWVSKEETFQILKKLIAYVTPIWVGHEWEFHNKCQPHIQEV